LVASVFAASVADANTKTRSILLLPFTPVDLGRDEQWIAEAVTQSLMLALTQAPSLVQIDRERFRQLSQPEAWDEQAAAAAAKALHAEIAVYGEVRRTGAELAIQPRYLELKGDRPERVALDVVTVPDGVLMERLRSISVAYTRALKLSLTESESARVQKWASPTTSVRAYESYVRGRLASYPMLLIGVVMNAIYLALILFIETAVDLTRIQGVMLWMVGNVPTEGYGLIAFLSVLLLVCVIVLAALGRDLNLLSAGEEVARSLGVTVERTRLVAVLVASLATAAVVSVTGLIGFVGLIVPHAARLLFGPDHRLLVPASALTGAIFLMAADSVARTVMAPTEIPVGVITALCGGPVFLWLYRAQRGATYFE